MNFRVHPEAGASAPPAASHALHSTLDDVENDDATTADRRRRVGLMLMVLAALFMKRGIVGALVLAVLATGAPVIPIGQWGAQEVLPAYTTRPHVVPRRTTHYKVGDPVDLSDLLGQPVTNEVLHEATDRIMAALTALVADLRGEVAPAQRFDPRRAGLRETGNPNGSRRRDEKGAQ